VVARGDPGRAPLVEGPQLYERDVVAGHGSGPELQVEPLAIQSTVEPGRWRAGWRVRNVSTQPVQLLEAWLPHGRFRAPAESLASGLQVPGGESALLELCVACSEPPGTEVENAFLILRLTWREQAWRLLARLRVKFDGAGNPHQACEALTVQPVGFSSQGRKEG
jgi:hypothetical protein